jgi:hypothetical protein
MLPVKESEQSLLPLAQDHREADESSESEAMLDHEYVETKPRSRIRRVCSSKIPWIFSTLALSLYILSSALTSQKEDVPWSPTDTGKFSLITAYD